MLLLLSALRSASRHTRLSLPGLAAFGLMGIAIADVPPRQFVQIPENAQEMISIKAPEIVWTDKKRATRLSLTNTSSETLRLEVISTHQPESNLSSRPNVKAGARFGGLEGFTRGFVGLICLGASEMAIESACPEGSIVSMHRLDPGETQLVEHNLPSEAVAEEVVTTIRIDTESMEEEREQREKEHQKRQHREARETYYRERKEEEARWKDLRQQLVALREKLPPLSSDYKDSMDKYWKAHAAYKQRLREIEDRFRSKQQPEDQESTAKSNP